MLDIQKDIRYGIRTSLICVANGFLFGQVPALRISKPI
jgi:hypothetical protein